MTIQDCSPQFEGNTKFSDAELSKQTGPLMDSPTNAENINSICQIVEAFYRKHGYADVDVSCRVTDWAFVIEEGEKVK